MKRFLLFLAVIVSAVSCINSFADQNILVDDSSKLLSVNVSMSSSASRVDVAESETGWSVSWNQSDMLGAWSTASGSNEQTCFTIAEGGYNAENSKFEGVTSYKEIRFVHPYDENLSKAESSISLSLENQTATDGFSHIGQNTYMISNVIDTADDITNDTSISMTHVGAAIELRLRFSGDVDISNYSLTQVVLGSEDGIVPTTAGLNTSTAELDITSCGAITITADQIEADVDGIYTIRFNSFPFDFAAGESLIVDATFLDIEYSLPCTASATVTNSTQETISLARATVNTIYATLGAIESNEYTFTVTYDSLVEAMNLTEPNQVTIAGAAFSLFTIDSDKNTATTPFRLFTSDTSMRSYSGNNVTFTAADDVALTKIAFSASSISAASYGTYSGKIWSGNSTETTLTLYNGVNSYINVTCQKSNALTNVRTPMIEDVTPSNLQFAFAGGTSIATLSGVDLPDAQFVASQSDNFNVTFDGTTLTVEAGENLSGKTIEESITIEVVGGNSVTLTLTQEQKDANATIAPAYTIYAADFVAENAASGTSVGVKNEPTTIAIGDTAYEVTFEGSVSNVAAYYISSDSDVGNLRIYVGEEMTISTTDGSLMSEIDINVTSSGYADIESVNTGELSISDKVISWKGLANSVTFTASDACRITSIEINLSVAVFNALTPSSISFECDDTTAQTITLEGDNLANAESITATLDDDSHFALSDIGDDFTFTVAPTAENTTTAAYSAIITVDVDGISRTVELTQAKAEYVEPLTMTLDYVSNFYAASGTDATNTYNSASFVANSLYYNTSYSNYTMSNGGYLYNTTELEGFTSLVIDEDGTYYNYTVYAGDEPKPLSTEVSYTVDGTNHIYEIPNDYSYFTIANNSGYSAYATSYTLYYTALGQTDGDSGSTTTPDTTTPDTGGSGDTSGDSGDYFTANTSWPELPVEYPENSDYAYAYHMCGDNESVRNFSVCYSISKKCPVWVAAPLSNDYIGDDSRDNNFINDPVISAAVANNSGWYSAGYDRGHMLASADRTISDAVNDQTCYYSNIAPQLSGFNGSATGDRIWGDMETYIRGLYTASSATLYIVNGAHWENTNTVLSTTGTTVPTHFYKALLWTTAAARGKDIMSCTTSELQCVAFYVEHSTYNYVDGAVSSAHMISIDELEAIVGQDFFSNVSAPEDSYTPSDWGL